ncbi:hypothetical protein SDC9_103466 [bioreactor metagenome]|uniref:Uncharacterized protein n=1 Tax=bioreactor metagenome TaxID=1076179 RepID=A0A645AU88_9ZZZZ
MENPSAVALLGIPVYAASRDEDQDGHAYREPLGCEPPCIYLRRGLPCGIQLAAVLAIFDFSLSVIEFPAYRYGQYCLKCDITKSSSLFLPSPGLDRSEPVRAVFPVALDS